ncbi:MAG: DUF6089 family protein [Chitinophagales bacterium]
MKHLIIIISVIGFQFGYSQTHELFLGLGAASYSGELNTTNQVSSLIKQAHPSYSVGYRYNFKNFLSAGVSLYHMNVSGYDSDNTSTTNYDAEYYRLVRNLSFFSAINQAFVDLRFEPFRKEANWSNGKTLISPFLSAGIGMFAFNPKTKYNGQDVELQPLGTEGQGTAGKPEKYSTTGVSFPLGLGVKVYDASRKFSLALDLNYSITNTDYIDDVSTVYANPAILSSPTAVALANRFNGKVGEEYINGVGQTRGNPNLNDGFYTAQLKFSFFLNNTGREAYYKCCGY